MGLNLIGKIELDGAGFERGLRRAGDHVTDFVKNATVAAFGFYGIEEAIRKTVETASDLVNESKRLDLTITQLQVLRDAARDAGTDMATVSKALEKINEARAKALGGDKTSLAAFAKLGVTPAQLKNQTAADIFTGPISDTAKNKNVQDLGPALKEIIGKGFGEVLPVLRDDLKETEDKLRKFGLITDTLTLVKLKNMGDELDLIGKIITTVLGPSLVKFADWLLEAVSHSKGVEGADFFLKRKAELDKAPKFTDSHGWVFDAEKRADASNYFAEKASKAIGKNSFSDFKANNSFAFQHVFEDFAGTTFKEFNEYLKRLADPMISANKAAAEGSKKDMSGFQKMIADWQKDMKAAAWKLDHPTPPDNNDPSLPQTSRLSIPSDALVKVGNFLGSNGNTIERVNQQKIQLLKRIADSNDKLVMKAPSSGGSFGTVSFPQ